MIVFAVINPSDRHMATNEIERHFDGKSPQVRAIYDAVLATAQRLGPVEEDSKKTSIHLNRRTAFLGVATRKTNLLLTIKSDSPWLHPLIAKSEQLSAKRWHHDLKLSAPDQLDDEIVAHIALAYELSA